MNDEEKRAKYAELTTQISALVDGVGNRVGALANVAALLKASFDYYFWVGFYVVRGGSLQLGPFQGPVACYRIDRGKGVCGMAWSSVRTIIVPNVNRFKGHIACSSASRSEIVVPIIVSGEVVAVIDVDSAELEAFNMIDCYGLERIAAIIADKVMSGGKKR